MNDLFSGSTNSLIKNEDELRKIIPPYPGIMDKRIVTELDHYCIEIIRFARFVILATSENTIPMQVLEASAVAVVDAASFKVAIKSETLGDCLCEGSLYFVVPGVGHGLRVNGHVEVEGQNLEFRVRGAFVHCARAAARAALWESNFAKYDDQPDPLNLCLDSYEQYIQHSPYLMLKTMNIANQTELSPRGDEAGFVKMINPDTIFIPERPGNKVAVSLRNILENPVVELLFFMPGFHSVLNVQGHALISTDEQLLKACAVNNKTPKLGILVNIKQCSIGKSVGLERSDGWCRESRIEETALTRFSKVLSAHMNGEGLLGKATTPLVQAIVKHDLKNLY